MTQPNKPTRRPRPSRKPKPNPVPKAEHLQPQEQNEDVKVLDMNSRKYLHNQLPENKYKQKPKVGTPTLGRSVGYVGEVGLGNLRTITAYDHSDIPTGPDAA